MTIRFDKEDDLFVIPTIVISKIDTKYVKLPIYILRGFGTLWCLFAEIGYEP